MNINKLNFKSTEYYYQIKEKLIKEQIEIQKTYDLAFNKIGTYNDMAIKKPTIYDNFLLNITNRIKNISSELEQIVNSINILENK